MAAVASPPMSPPQRPMSPNSVTSDDADEELDLLDFLQEGPQATTEVSLSRLHLRERDDDASSKEAEPTPQPAPTPTTSGSISVLYSSPQALVSFLSLLPNMHSKNMYKLRNYPDSFRANELVSVLVRQKIAATREDAVVVAQRLVDEHLIWHAVSDQPFKDSSAPFRFVTPRIYNVWLQIKDPDTGLHQYLVAQDVANGVKPRPSPSHGRCPPFSGKELVDFIQQMPPVKNRRPSAIPRGVMLREDCVRLAEGLLNNYVIRLISGSEDHFQETYTYGIIREYVTLQSFQGLITMKEWLNSQMGGKQWKQRFFVLVPDHQRVYFFDSEEALRPRGAIELKRSIPRGVDESMFNRKHIIQLVTDGGSLFLETKNQENYEQWMAALLAVTQEQTQVAKTTSEGRQLRSFRLRIDECRDLPTAFQGGYYTLISFGNNKVARTQTKYNSKTGNPVFTEEFFFSELPRSVETVHVSVMSRSKVKQDTEIGYFDIELQPLTSHKINTEWFNLNRPDDDKTKAEKDRKPMQIKLTFTLEYELILPLRRYDRLLTLLTEDYALAANLLSTATGENDQALVTILRIFECQNKSLDFIMYLINRELNATSERNVLFRINSLATRVLILYLKLVSVPYMQDVLRPTITRPGCANLQNVLEGKYTNVDVAQTSTILPIAQELFDTIQKNLQRFPPFLYRFFHDLRNAANSRFGPREGEVVPVGSQIVNGFLFLRLFCPAIVAPQLYGLADSDPDQRAGRILKVIARVLQYLANFKTEIEGEVFTPENVKAINAFLAENQDAMRAFVDTICSRERATLRVYGRAALPVDLERELAHLYYYVVRYSAQLSPLLAKDNRMSLGSVTEDISNAYKKQWPQNSQPYHYAPPTQA